MKILISLVAVLSSTLASIAAASSAPAVQAGINIHAQADHGKTEFHAVGRPSLIKVNGEGKGPEGALQVEGVKVAGDLALDLTSLTTGISMRDEHMKEKYLETGKYPQAKLHLTDVSLPADWVPGAETKNRAFKGDLTLHGQTKPVNGTFDVGGPMNSMVAVARFTIDISQFGIEIPKYLGITIRNEVPIELTMNDLKATR